MMTARISKTVNSTSFSLLLLCLVFLSDTLLAQRPVPLAANSEEIEVLPVQGNIYLIATGGSNIAVMLGELGVVVVDSGNIEASDNVVRAI